MRKLLTIKAKTFNPDVLYVFDADSTGPHSGKNHYHDFFEMTVLLEGESFYKIHGQEQLVKAGTILLFNPGVEHHEYIPEGKSNKQLHIGIRHFTIDRFPRDYFPLDATSVQLSEYHDDFFNICWEMVRERHEGKNGHELILKSLVLKLMVYLLRDKETQPLEDKALLLSEDEQKRQQLVTDIKDYIELNHTKDLTLNQIAKDLFSSPATISRVFKEQLGDTPINYLIRYRLEKAKTMMESSDDISVSEVSRLIGYDDAYYFSKLFKKYYGSSPTNYVKQSKRSPY